MADSQSTVSRNLGLLRRILGLSQQEFAMACGLSPSVISRVESGKIEPTAKLVAAVCRAIPVKYDRLFASEFLPKTHTEPAGNEARA